VGENPVDLFGYELPGVPGMRMVVFSLALIMIILFRREGLMGMRELHWQSLFKVFSRGRA